LPIPYLVCFPRSADDGYAAGGSKWTAETAKRRILNQREPRFEWFFKAVPSCFVP